MEPLFENHLTVDKNVLLEWYKKEFYRDNPFFVGVHAGLIVVYLALAGVVLMGRGLLPTWLAAASVALFIALAVGFLANLLLRYRMQVRQLLKSDEGKRFPAHLDMVYYADFAMPTGQTPGQDPAGQMLACVGRAAAMQQEFSSVMTQLNGWTAENGDGLEQLRSRLVLLQKQLGELSAEARDIGGQQHNYGALTDYAQTQNLHILHFGDTAVLAAKNGFTLGEDSAFGEFVAARLRAVATATPDEKRRKRLEKALRNYFA